MVNVFQDSDKWLQWRRSVISATDAAVIMGVSPYCKPDKLRLKKLGLAPEQKVNQYMQRGKNLEPEAREAFNKEYGMSMSPICVESSEHPFLGASLDGYYSIADDTSFILEIKCPQKKSMDEAKSGRVKPLYIAQIQHMLIVTGADCCYYYCYDGNEGHTIEVYPDEDWQKAYLPKAEEFYMSLIFSEKKA